MSAAPPPVALPVVQPLTVEQRSHFVTFAAALEATASRFRLASTRLEGDAAFAEIDALVDDQIAMRRLPTLPEIARDLRDALDEFVRVSANVSTAAQAWGDEALCGPSLRAQCVAELMGAESDFNPNGQAMSRNAADKSVTAHPIYAAHKEKLDELVRHKYDAETAASVAGVRCTVLTEISANLRTSALTGA
jgi:hypothetical protein